MNNAYFRKIILHLSRIQPVYGNCFVQYCTNVSLSAAAFLGSEDFEEHKAWSGDQSVQCAAEPVTQWVFSSHVHMPQQGF